MMLDPKNLTLGKEKAYFTWIVLFSILGWLLILVTVIGFIYALFIGFFLWIANGLLIAHLKANAIKINSEQYQALDQSLKEVCERLEVKQIPALYLMQHAGVLNAFATRFAGRDFVVLYSEMLETYGDSSSEIKFVLGHELGHIQSRHLLKRLFTLPGYFVPLLGNAYSRACEASCDRFGAFASSDLDGSIRAMVALASGKYAVPHLSALKFAAQYKTDRGFFVSLHELISTYPTLSQRVANLIAIQGEQPLPTAPRHWLAFPFGLFGGAAGRMILILSFLAVYVGLLIPAISGAVKKAQAVQAQAQKRQTQAYPNPNLERPMLQESAPSSPESMPPPPAAPAPTEPTTTPATPAPSTESTTPPPVPTPATGQ